MKTPLVITAALMFSAVLTVIAAEEAQKPAAPVAAEAQKPPDVKSAAEPVPAAESVAPAKQANFRPYVGRITGDKVNLRSGPSTNYYPIMQGSFDQLVRVVGAEFGWLKISPPKGAYSLIDQGLVDKADDGKGVVNGDAVWVRAASLLPEHARKKYAKQVKLNRGAILTLLGETEDGFYRIAPPKNAFIWVSDRYVAKVPSAPAFVWQDHAWVLPEGAAGLAEPSAPSAVAKKADESGSATSGAKPASTGPGGKGASTALAKGGKASRSPTTQPAKKKIPDKQFEAKQQKLIAAIEKDLEIELAKPLVERNVEPLIKRFQPIARQEGESVSKIYAQQRIRQLKDQIESIAAVKRVSALAQELLETRKRFAEQRRSIEPLPPSSERAYDVRGQFSKSMVYNNPVGPRRYRIVDPNSVPARTLAYVEVPPGKQFDPAPFLGRFVGVRATARRLQQGVVKPLPIFLLGEIAPLKENDVLVQAPAGDLARGTPGERAIEESVEQPVVEEPIVEEPPQTDPTDESEAPKPPAEDSSEKEKR